MRSATPEEFLTALQYLKLCPFNVDLDHVGLRKCGCNVIEGYRLNGDPVGFASFR